jgi:hypothetical protein
VKRVSPEFLAIPVVLVGLGILFAIFWAGNGGAGRWIVVGLLFLAGIVGLLALLFRRPRGDAPFGELAPFNGAASPISDGVHRVLVVAGGAPSSGDLEQIAGAAAGQPTAAYVVAPAISSRVTRWTGDERACGDAQANLESTVRSLSGLGMDANGHLGPHDPLQAADDGLREFPADEIVFVWNARDETDWLEQGVAETARTRYGIPVRAFAEADR